MTARDRITVGAVLCGLAVLALYAGAALHHAAGFIAAVLLGGAGVALLLNPPKDHP